MAQRLIGIKQISIDGKIIDSKGWDYGPGGDQLESVSGHGRLHGFKVKATMPGYAEGKITDSADLRIKDLIALRDATVMIELQNGKTVKLSHAAFVAEGKVTGEESEIEARFECDPNDADEF